MKPYIQPFERRLAIEELAALAASRPVAAQAGESSVMYSVQTSVPHSTLVRRLAYWERIEESPTQQVRREATANLVRNSPGIAEVLATRFDLVHMPPPSRRCLRYGTHGLHEYRGKFFPQLVRALLNMAGAGPHSVVADPLMGSGTTPVEAILSSCYPIGLDLNPLSVFMAQTKCEMLAACPEALAESYAALREAVLKARPPATVEAAPYFRRLPEADRTYLLNWFPREALLDLDLIACEIEEVHYKAAKQLAWLSLSNVLRRVSWQKVDDLRVRRELKPAEEIDAVREFLAELGRNVRTVLSFVVQETRKSPVRCNLRLGDARDVGRVWARYKGRVKTVITSPPYATALPYLDTDRLSLVYLQLLTRPMHRQRDGLMIGNREVTERLRREYWQSYERNRKSLPRSSTELVDRIHHLNSTRPTGFRRRNLAALLGKYFLDMKAVMRGILGLMERGASAFVVVGSNRTTAGGEVVDINTPGLLGDIAEAAGLERNGEIRMEMLVSRDIFRKNAVPSESVLWLRRPKR